MITCGLDIGSRSVKAVLYRVGQGKILASHISLRTTDTRAVAALGRCPVSVACFFALAIAALIYFWSISCFSLIGSLISF